MQNEAKNVQRNKVLIIAYYFPPVGGGGVQRTTKFVKYLRHFAWEPVVLTVKEEIHKKANRVIDKTLLRDIPKKMNISRTNCIDLGRMSVSIRTSKSSSSNVLSIRSLVKQIGGFFINPDAQMLWIPIAVRVGLKLIRKHRIQVIYSTANPWSDHIIGALLSKISGLPWVADYRDAWNLNPWEKYTSAIRRKIQMFLETKVIQTAQRVIFTTDGTRLDYKKVFGNGKFTTIRNAFDPEDFTFIKPIKTSKFTILYSGSTWYYRKLSYFLHGVSNWTKKHPNARQHIVINFLGKLDSETRAIIEQENLEDVSNLLGYRKHKESIAYLLGASVLFITLDENGETVVPGKLYEYLASGKPILACLPPLGTAADILRKEGRGSYIIGPRDIVAIEEKLLLLYNNYRKHCLPSYHVDNLQEYTRKKATEKLCKIFNDLRFQKVKDLLMY